MNKQYTSRITWPEESGIGVSTDTHTTEKAAIWVCKQIFNKGMGLDGEVFPVKCEVVDPDGEVWYSRSQSERVRTRKAKSSISGPTVVCSGTGRPQNIPKNFYKD